MPGAWEQPTEQVEIDPSKVNQLNPFVNQFWDMLTGNIANFTRGLEQFSPEANLAALPGIGRGAQALTGNLLGEFGGSAMDLARTLGQQAASQVGQQFSNLGAINSGAFASALGRGFAEPLGRAATQIAGMQGQLGGSLAQQLLGQRGTALGTQAGLLGQGLGIAGGFAQPEYLAPAVIGPRPGPLQGLLGLLGGVGTSLLGNPALFGG
jgi:hypothetical protein